jgi:hypothetical protein
MKAYEITMLSVYSSLMFGAYEAYDITLLSFHPPPQFLLGRL